MPSSLPLESVVFILNALKLGLVTVEQVENALDVCRGEPGLTVADVLMENEVITEDQRMMIDAEADDDMGDMGTMASVVTPSPADLDRLPEARNVADFDDASDRMITAEQAGRYEVLRQYAVGGQARILLTFDEHLQREVALKEMVLDGEEPTGGTPTTGQRHTAGMARFLREARVTGMLEHPNIVPVYELGRRADGRHYYTMRFVRGMTLAQKLRGSQSLSDRLKLMGVFWDVCKAIAFAHSRGVVHRDIKPLNIMVGEFGETVVLDWGVAKVKGLKDIRARAIEKELHKLQVSSGMTTAGTAIGTPSYMSPEQAGGDIDNIDERSDVWGLGALLYEILTGQPPYRGAVAAETMNLVLTAEIHPVQKLCPQVSPDLAAITEKCLQKDREQRYQSAKDLADEIGAYMTGEKVQAYEYSAWELIRRFVTRHKAAVIATFLMVVAIVASLLTARYLRIRELDREIDALASRFEVLEFRLESLEKLRKTAFAFYDADFFKDGENKWRQALHLTGELEPQYSDMWASLRGLLASHPESETGLVLKTKLLERLMTVSCYGGRQDLSEYYKRLLLEEDRDGSFRRRLDQPGKYTVLSQPEGARLSLSRFTSDSKGLVNEEKVKDLGTAPLAGLELPEGSYLIEASHPDHLTVRYPLLAERGEDRVLSIPLPKNGVVPEGMVYIPPGEFLVGSDEQEEIRHHTGAAPRHKSYTQGFLISGHEVTFAEYLPFIKEQKPEQREKYLPRGPYELKLDDGPVLSFQGQSRGWGEKFEFPDCPDCTAQDWRQWPVVVSRKAAEDYAKFMSRKLGERGNKLELRLPTEREWEKAARGADGRKYPSGDTLPEDYAITRATHGAFHLVQEAGSAPKGRGIFDIHDLAGNVWEWVMVGSTNYAVKGGSFQEPPLMTMAASRIKGEDVSDTHATGFRLAALLPGGELCPLDAEAQGSKTVLIARAQACRSEGIRNAYRADHDLAIAQYKKVLELSRAAYGEQHVETARAYNIVGVGYVEKGVHDEKTLEYLEKSLAIRLKLLGPDDLDVGGSYNNIGLVYHWRGQLDKALEYYNKCLDTRLKGKGPDHPWTADVYYNISEIYLNKFEYDRSLEYILKALNIYQRALGLNHMDTGITYTTVGDVYRSMGAYEKALEYQKKSMAVLTEVVGPEHAWTADSYSNIGETYKDMGSYPRALEYTERALKIYMKTTGPDHYNTVTAYNTAGTVKRETRRYDQALEYFNKSLQSSTKTSGPEHSSVAQAHLLIGGVYCEMGSYEKALTHFQRSLAIFEKSHGPDHVETVAAFLQLAQVHQESGNQEEAERFLQKALASGQKVCATGKANSCADAAVASCMLGKCDEQVMAMADKGLAISPRLTDTQEAKAFLLVKSGKVKEGKKIYCKLKSLGPLTQSAARKRVRQYCP